MGRPPGHTRADPLRRLCQRFFWFMWFWSPRLKPVFRTPPPGSCQGGCGELSGGHGRPKFSADNFTGDLMPKASFVSCRKPDFCFHSQAHRFTPNPSPGKVVSPNSFVLTGRLTAHRTSTSSFTGRVCASTEGGMFGFSYGTKGSPMKGTSG